MAWSLLATLEYALELPLQVAPQTLAIAITAAAGSGSNAAPTVNAIRNSFIFDAPWKFVEREGLQPGNGCKLNYGD